MTHAETEPMSRPLLALCLYAFAAIAIAGTPVGQDEAGGKPAKPATATASSAESDAAPAATPAPAPSRAGSPSRSAKRWHSMLPGMIR
jgi:hypothetical protein